jgi:hypothetical protein
VVLIPNSTGEWAINRSRNLAAGGSRNTAASPLEQTIPDFNSFLLGVANPFDILMILRQVDDPIFKIGADSNSVVLMTFASFTFLRNLITTISFSR